MSQPNRRERILGILGEFLANVLCEALAEFILCGVVAAGVLIWQGICHFAK